ncbi:hypothetical protein [Paraburkholderia sp. HP33-1]|uniref:hypothetical protein n=1 Tax=Paraburkholderia sp. HP33-1 TaxID=2883243 RepID=UPI001F340837|nr:hypothetical protein [Paraburkholderia sp. HP33-1]
MSATAGDPHRDPLVFMRQLIDSTAQIELQAALASAAFTVEAGRAPRRTYLHL